MRLLSWNFKLSVIKVCQGSLPKWLVWSSSLSRAQRKINLGGLFFLKRLLRAGSIFLSSVHTYVAIWKSSGVMTGTLFSSKACAW